MLRIARIVGMTLISMLAIGGVASAHVFEAEKAGSVTRAANALQIFTAEEGGPKVECETDAVTNASFTQTKQLHLLADISYSGCNIPGLGAATVSTAKYLFSADGGLVRLENTVLISAPFECMYTIHPQHFPTGITFQNKGNNIVVIPSVKGIVSLGTGGLGLCKNSTNGLYSGSTEVTSAGQVIKWV